MKKLLSLSLGTALGLSVLLSAPVKAAPNDVYGQWVQNASSVSGLVVTCAWVRLNYINYAFVYQFAHTVGYFQCPLPKY
ncbi:hypothetical protein [Serratia sp. D1N4]|jgi:hypothetical protein